MDKPENDNIGLFMLDLFCTFAAVGLIGFCIYIAPYVFTGQQYYDVPEFIVRMNEWYRNEKELGGVALAFAMFAPFILGAMGFFGLAKLISAYIHRLEIRAKQKAKEKGEVGQQLNEREGMVAATRVSVIMFLLIIFVIMLLLLIEFLFSSEI